MSVTAPKGRAGGFGQESTALLSVRQQDRGASPAAPSPKAIRIPAKAPRSRVHPQGGRWEPCVPGHAKVQRVGHRRSVTLVPAPLSAPARGCVPAAAPTGPAAGCGGGRARGLNLSANFGALVLPEGDLAVVAAGGQQARLLRVPGHAVDVLRVGPGDVGGEAEGGLLRVGGRALLEDSDGVVAAGRRQRPGEVAPRARAAPGGSPALPPGENGAGRAPLRRRRRLPPLTTPRRRWSSCGSQKGCRRTSRWGRCRCRPPLEGKRINLGSLPALCPLPALFPNRLRAVSEPCGTQDGLGASPSSLPGLYRRQMRTVLSSLQEAKRSPLRSKATLHTVDSWPSSVAQHTQSSSSSWYSFTVSS